MVIKASRKIHALTFLFLTVFLSIMTSLYWNGEDGSDGECCSEQDLLKTSNVLIDKVYEFTTSNPSKVFDNIEFSSQYTYYFYFKLVTPHECELSVRIVDPEGSSFDVFYDGNFNQEGGMHQFPFGAAIQGPHDIHFDVLTTLNLNIYIKIERTVKCLYDIIATQELDKMRKYSVSKFEALSSELQEIEFQSDAEYEIYIARVSPISISIPDNRVDYNCTLEDIERGIIFDLNWKHLLLKPIGEVTRISFGTSNSGTYELNLSVYYEYNPVNIAYAVLYDHDLSDEIDANQTDSIVNDGDFNNLLATIPAEYTAAFIGAIGILLFIAVILVTKSRRKGNASFGIFDS